jgi:hypothetical protein
MCAIASTPEISGNDPGGALRADDGVQRALTLISTRLYFGLMPENPTYPAVTYMQAASRRETAMGANPGIVHATFQFDAYDTDRTACATCGADPQIARPLPRDERAERVADLRLLPREHRGADAELVDGVPVYRGMVEVLVQHTE